MNTWKLLSLLALILLVSSAEEERPIYTESL